MYKAEKIVATDAAWRIRITFKGQPVPGLDSASALRLDGMREVAEAMNIAYAQGQRDQMDALLAQPAQPAPTKPTTVDSPALRNLLQEWAEARGPDVSDAYDAIIAHLDALFVPARPALKPQSDLHSAIMALSCEPIGYVNCPTSYFKGRDAMRDAAAELVAALLAQPAAPAKPQSDLHSRLMSAVEMVCNMLARDGKPVRKEAADELRHAAAELVAAAQSERAASAIWLWDEKKEQHVLAVPLAASVGAQVAGEPVSDKQKALLRADLKVMAAVADNWDDDVQKAFYNVRAYVIETLYTAPVPAPATVDRDAKLDELRGQIKDMQEAAYTYGDYSKEAVRVALDGVLDAIDGLAAPATVPQPKQEALGWKLAMRVLQSDLYRHLDDSERAECDALVECNPTFPQGVEAQKGQQP